MEHRSEVRQIFGALKSIATRALALDRQFKRARELLRHLHLPITDIAPACGFSDHSHFGKVFCEHTGIAPSVWRRERGGTFA